MFAYFGADSPPLPPEKERERNFGRSSLKLCFFAVFLSPGLEKSLYVHWEESVLKFGSLETEQGWSVFVETIRRGRINGSERKTLRIHAGKPKLRDTKTHRLRGGSWELEGYRRYAINN